MNFIRHSRAIAYTLTLMTTSAMLNGCQHVNVAQITYEVLRAEDCRRNQLEDFCSRTYASEYYDYVRLREDFLREHQPAGRLGQSNKVSLPEGFNTL